MKKLLIIILFLLLLGGAAAAGWWFFLRPKDENAEAPPPPPPVLTQIDLPLIPISIVKEGKAATQRVDFLISVVFDDPAKQARVTERMPRLMDGIIAELHGLLPRKMVEQGGFDRTYLEERLTKMAEGRFGKGTINKIYIRDMQIYK